eukprot:GFUD01025042.1.p1 GENE.GFUD01025042.1~~GFUD01025042.1.p1  ORF type:complete len:715 (-),score=125.78 GFUD01025042.1:4-1974(-)
MDGGDGSDVCFKHGNLTSECNQCRKLPGLPKKYCQPGEACWPTQQQIANFSEAFHGDSMSCLGLKRLVHVHDPSAHKQICLSYTGLQRETCKSKHSKHSNSIGNYGRPDPGCNANPFITNAFYNKSSRVKTSCMTPYQFLNNRNYKLEWKAAFIVTANTSEDVSKALIFARTHKLGVSIMATGHELNDRNAGPGPNSLQIRTTCFREFTFMNSPIKGYKGEEWTDGYAVVGAGLTFGNNFWLDIENAEGLYPLAAKHDREICGGSCHSVGIVGWSLAGGKGFVTPMYGLGVDQLLHVDVVSSNGTALSANFTHNPDLFYAMRGGGGGFGVVTSLKIKLHKPICNGSMDQCYSYWNTSWTGVWNKKSMEQQSELKKVISAAYEWRSKNDRFWNGFVEVHYSSGNYSIAVGGFHFGKKEGNVTQFNSFQDAFQNLTISGSTHTMNNKPAEEGAPPTITNKYWCLIFPDPKNTSNCDLHPTDVQRWRQSIRFLVNFSTIAKKERRNALVDALMKYWQPMCDEYTNLPCVSGYSTELFFPAIDEATGKGVYATGGAISEGFREVGIQIYNTGVNSNNISMTFEEQENWMHFTLAPAMYKFSNASYFNEAEYTLNDGQWEERFWGKEIHCKLSQIKRKYDPDFTLACRHCIGSEVGSEPNE